MTSYFFVAIDPQSKDIGIHGPQDSTSFPHSPFGYFLANIGTDSDSHNEESAESHDEEDLQPLRRKKHFSKGI